jgi:hypothetical protein
MNASRILLVVFVAAAVAACDQFTAEGRRRRTLQRLNESGTVVRRSCGLGEIHVDGARWGGMKPADQESAAAALASYCVEQGGEPRLTVFDANSHAAIARWTGSTLERTR